MINSSPVIIKCLYEVQQLSGYIITLHHDAITYFQQHFRIYQFSWKYKNSSGGFNLNWFHKQGTILKLRISSLQLLPTPCLWKLVKYWSQRSYFCIFKKFILKNCWKYNCPKSLKIAPKMKRKMFWEWFVNYWELLQNNWLANHWELSRITENHRESPLNNFRLISESLRIAQKWLQNGFRITKNCWESVRITPKQFQTDSWITTNHWESPQKWFQSGSPITKNHQESLRIDPK